MVVRWAGGGEQSDRKRKFEPREEGPVSEEDQRQVGPPPGLLFGLSAPPWAPPQAPCPFLGSSWGRFCLDAPARALCSSLRVILPHALPGLEPVSSFLFAFCFLLLLFFGPASWSWAAPSCQAWLGGGGGYGGVLGTQRGPRPVGTALRLRRLLRQRAGERGQPVDCLAQAPAPPTAWHPL